MGGKGSQARRVSLGFTMVELMVVVLIVGVLAAIATPIYARYVFNSRITEATGQMADILTAAKSFAIANEDGDPSTVEWPASCGERGFFGDCEDSPNFRDYEITPGGTDLKITARGREKMAGYIVTMSVSDLVSNGVISVQRLGGN